MQYLIHIDTHRPMIGAGGASKFWQMSQGWSIHQKDAHRYASKKSATRVCRRLNEQDGYDGTVYSVVEVA